MNLDPREIARYLGIRGKALDPQGTAWADQCQRELAQAVTPRHLGRRLPLTLFQGQSRDLDHHLRHCREGILYAVTLGPEADRLLRRWSAQSMAKAAVGQAVCAAWLDDLCAAYCATLEQDLAPGEYLTPPLQPWLWGLEPGGPAVGPGPPPGPQAPGTHPHRREDAGAREVGNRPGGHQRPERGGLQAKMHALHQTRLPLPGRASGGSPRTLMFLFQPRERALSGARSRCLYLTRKGRLSQ